MEEHVVSTFPPPPVEYYSRYTDENVKSDKVPKPPPIIEGSYEMYGMKYNTRDPTIPSLESQKIQRLYLEDVGLDRLAEMRKINFSILVNFIELLDIMTKSPFSSKRQEKLNQLSVLFINLHHLINEYRPHQARETLKAMLELQKTKQLEAVDKINKCVDEVQRVIDTCQDLVKPVCEADEESTDVEMTELEEDRKTSVVEIDDQSCLPVNRWLCSITDNIE